MTGPPEPGPPEPSDPPTPATAPQSFPLPLLKPRALRSLLIGSVIAVALAVLLFVVLAPSSKSGSGASGPVVGIGSRAPGFSLPSLTGGEPVDLAVLGADVHRPVVLNFFASWCIPCQKETPLLARTAAAEQAKGSSVQFIGVDVNDRTSDALAFVTKAGITYPVGVDQNFQVSSGKYGLYGLPQTFYIDATGTVIGHTFGAVKTSAELMGWLHRLGATHG